MVTRYLAGAAFFMGRLRIIAHGLLDFYGNSFDPRATGISVSRRLYFARRAPPMTHAVYQPPDNSTPCPTATTSPSWKTRSPSPPFIHREGEHGS
jgi:hypothetical protein